MAIRNNSSDIRKAYTNKVATANKSNARRIDIIVTATASKPIKKRTDTKIMVTANKTAIANINEPTNNARRTHANVVATADTNVMVTTNKAISKAKKQMPMYRQLQMPT